MGGGLRHEPAMSFRSSTRRLVAPIYSIERCTYISQISRRRIFSKHTMRIQAVSWLLVGLVYLVPASLGQDPQSLFDTPFPSTYNGFGAVPVPSVASSQFHFPTITGTADQQQALSTYPQGFPAVACNSTGESFNISFGQLHTPEGTQDYAVHLSLLNPYPNNITGPSTGTNQAIFSIVMDTWLNLRTGVVSGLNYTQNSVTDMVYTFDAGYDGQTAQFDSGRADATEYSPVQYISPNAFYGVSDNSNGKDGLTYFLYPPPALNSVGANDSGTHQENEFYWVQNVESLSFYGGFIAMQATLGAACDAQTAGFFQLAPLLDYLTDILQDVVSDDTSTYSDQRLGQLNATYVQSNSSLSPDKYATLRTTQAYLPVDQLINDPALSVTESECMLLAKNYTLSVANPKGSPPANVWNFCATGICNYIFANGSSGESISPYAGVHTQSTCQLGYSSAVDNNEYVEPAYIQSPGLGSAGRFNPARPFVVNGPIRIIQTSSSSFIGTDDTPTGLGGGAEPYSDGASNAPPESPPTSSEGRQ